MMLRASTIIMSSTLVCTSTSTHLMMLRTHLLRSRREQQSCTSQRTLPRSLSPITPPPPPPIAVPHSRFILIQRCRRPVMFPTHNSSRSSAAGPASNRRQGRRLSIQRRWNILMWSDGSRASRTHVYVADSVFPYVNPLACTSCVQGSIAPAFDGCPEARYRSTVV
jgi:hypothetical protein